MKVSLIHCGLVEANKRKCLNRVSAVEPFSTMKDLSNLLIKYCVAPATYYENQLDKKHFEGIELLCYEFADGVSVATIHDKIKHYNHVIAATENHLIDIGDGKGLIPRFRVFIQIESPIFRIGVYSSGVEYFAIRRGIAGKQALCKDPTRYFSKHSSILSVEDNKGWVISYALECEWQRQQREIWIKNRNKPKYTLSANLPTFKGAVQTRTSISQFMRTKYWQLLLDGVCRIQSERKENARTILRCMKMLGMHETDAIRIISEHSEWDNQYTPGILVRMADDILNRRE